MVDIEEAAATSAGAALQPQHARIAIVGGGFSGLGLAIRLKQQSTSVLELSGEVSPMDTARKYRIHDLKTGQVVGFLNADGALSDEGDPQAIAQLKELLQRELVVRDRQFTFGAEDEDEGYELFPEGSMCYVGLITLRPGDPEYLPAFLCCLPSISTYEAHAVQE